MIRTGILGGTFDPPHIGHIRLAEECVTALKLQRLLIIPTGDSGNSGKNEVTSFDKRFEMAKIAFGGIDKVSVLDIERGTKSYTYDTLRKLKPMYRNSDFYIIMGSDQLFCLENWYHGDSLLKEAKVAAFPRHENEYADMLEEAARIGGVRVLNFPVTDVSSTEIRSGNYSENVLSPEIEEYIKENGLYSQ